MRAIVQNVARAPSRQNLVSLNRGDIFEIFINLSYYRLLTGDLMEEFSKLMSISAVLHLSNKAIDV